MAATTRVPCIVFAAGRSRRMGRPKGSLPFAGSTMVGTVVRRLLEAGAEEILVVTRSEIASSLDLPADPRVRIAFNEVDSEMIDSFRVGVTLLCRPGFEQRPGTSGRPSPLGILAVPGDTPAIRTSTYLKCLDAFRRQPARIVIAAFGNKRGHPAIFPVALLDRLDQLAAGLKELVDRNADRVQLVETDDPEVLRDVDTLADYESLVGHRLSE